MKRGFAILTAIESQLSLPPGELTSKFGNSLSTLRLLHYPPLPKGADHPAMEREGDSLFSTPTYTDSGILTILFQDQGGGLEVQTKEGSWFAVAPEPDTLMINIGDVLVRWVGSGLVATPHRVRYSEGSRYSVPFFFEPEGDALLKLCDPSGEPPHRCSYAEYLSEKLKGFAEYQGL